MIKKLLMMYLAIKLHTIHACLDKPIGQKGDPGNPGPTGPKGDQGKHAEFIYASCLIFNNICC